MDQYIAKPLGVKNAWVVIHPRGFTEAVLDGPDAERRAKAIRDEMNAELWKMEHPSIRRETERMQHGDLVVVSERRSDGTLVLRIDPGTETLEVHTYPRTQGGVIR